jgi:ATP-dependent DNA helicase RecG
MSALANLPGGGTIILGLDERNGFRPVRLSDPQTLKQGLAAKARTYTPPVRLTISDAVVDGEPVVVARVHFPRRSARVADPSFVIDPHRSSTVFRCRLTRFMMI